MIYIEGGRACLYQWDVDQRLEVVNSDVREVHFSSVATSHALVCEVYEEGGRRYANIPNVLLQQAWAIQAYGCCESQVRDVLVCRIVRRAKPDDYVYTETEVKRYEDLEERIKALEEGGGGGSGGGITTESDPTVPAWAKNPNKPTYTAKEVGALPADTPIPEAYTLPTASADVKGGVMIGEGLRMDGEILRVAQEGTYERIETITLKEDTAKIIRDSYRLKAAVITFLLQPTALFFVRTTVFFNSGLDIWATVRYNDTAYKMGGRIEISPQYGGYYTIGGYAPNASYSNMGTEQSMSSSDRFKVPVSDEITGFEILGTSGISLPAGTKIEIWGVRADA